MAQHVRKWSNIFNQTAVAERTIQLVDSASTIAAPSTPQDGVALRKGASRLQLVYSTTGNAGAVTFRVWYHLPGCGWYLDDSLGAAGSITVAAITDPQRALIVEYPGDRVAVEVTANAAATDLDIWAFDDIVAY
jgi:hypothetical protein